jgi:hypothetical protein
MTIGTAAPTGTSVSTNSPFVSVRVTASGVGVIAPPHGSQVAPLGSGASGPLGT